MRTTLSLDDDVAALLNRVRRLRKSGLKEIVNEALRHGLKIMTAPSRRPSGKFVTGEKNLGRCLIGNLDDVSDALAIGEGEDHR